jgi:hypothetical protein
VTPGLLQVAPKSVKVIFENDKIRVMEVRFKKGQKVPWYSSPDHFEYALTSFRIKSISPGGKWTTSPKVKKGDSWFVEARPLSALESLTSCAVLRVELK